MKHAGQLLALGLIGILLMNVMMTVTISSTVSSALVTETNVAKATSNKCESLSNTEDENTTSSNSSFSADDNARKIAQVFADAGYSKAATAGVLGNLQAESGFNPTAASGDNGYGIAQWTPRSKIRAWFDANGLSDKEDSDLESQTKMLVGTAKSSFNNYYLSNASSSISIKDNNLYKTWVDASDPETAAVAWMAGWERPNWSLRHEDVRRQTAKNYYENGLNGITFDTSKRHDDDTNSNSSSSSDGDEDSTTACSTNTSESNDGDASYGSVGGAPTDTHSFSWMCSGSQKVCKDGDAGVFYPHLEYGYQCVWYAWNRLAMIHGNDGWNWVMGNGGDIWANVQGKSVWELSDTPKPGDGASGKTQPFAGSTHVAVVEEVQSDPSGWKVRISEGNYNGSATFNSYNSRWLTKTQMSGIHFFRNTNWKS